MDDLMKEAISQGFGYALFCFLLLYVLKTTGDRERRYQDLLDKLTEKFSIIEDIKSDVKEVKDHIFKK